MAFNRVTIYFQESLLKVQKTTRMECRVQALSQMSDLALELTRNQG